MAQAVIRARTDLDASGFNKGISAMQASATRLKGFVAGAFSVGAMAGFTKHSLDLAGNLNDVADQFGMTASEVDGFTRAVQNAGGSSKTASTILNALKVYQEKIGDTRPLSEFITSINDAYVNTGDFGTLLELVGTKNTALFISAMKGATDGIASFNDEMKNETAKTADSISESYDQVTRDLSMSWAKAVVDVVRGAKQLKEAFASMFRGEGFVAGLESFDTSERVKKMEEENAQMEVLLRARKYAFKEAGFVGPINPYDVKNMPSGFVGPMLAKPEKISERDFARDVNFDSLRRIGFNSLGAGRSQNDVASILKRAETYQKQIADNTAKMAGKSGGTTF